MFTARTWNKLVRLKHQTRVVGRADPTQVSTLSIGIVKSEMGIEILETWGFFKLRITGIRRLRQFEFTRTQRVLAKIHDTMTDYLYGNTECERVPDYWFSE